MTEPDDMQLLREYAATNSEDAFAALVQRHVNLVYSVALRHVGDSHRAQDVTQAVFIILARKAASLRRETILTGWLYQTARLTAASFLRGEIRRQHREQESLMQSTLDQSQSGAAWEQLAPLLDDAMGRLGRLDRNLLLLRFFEGKSSAEAAAALHLNEPAAKRRCTRAIEKLRRIFSRRGVDSTTATIAETISTHSVQVAPALLAKSVTAVALAKGATASLSTLTLIEGALKIMAWTKIKTAAVAGIAALAIVGTTTTVAVKKFHSRPAWGGDHLSVGEIVTNAQARYASLSSYSDAGTIVSTISGQTVTHTFATRLARPNLYRIDWREAIGFGTTVTGTVWSAGQGHFLKASGMDQTFPDQQTALTTATGISGGATSTIPGVFFGQNRGNRLGALLRGATRRADERIGNVDCYVLAGVQPGNLGMTNTLWIGKDDWLIHQVRTDLGAALMNRTLQAAAKRNPQMPASIQAGDATIIETHSNLVLNASMSPLDFQQYTLQY